jgi:hypothetical protein
MKSIAEGSVRDDASEAAIARVLRAEREARESIVRAQAEVLEIAERARKDARTLAERTERRIRVVVQAFERELAERLAEIDAEAAGLERAEPIDADEQAAVQRAVEALAQQLIGARA